MTITDLKNTVWTVITDLSEVDPEGQHRLKVNHSILMPDGRKYTNHKDFYIGAYSSYGGYYKGDFYSFADYDGGNIDAVKLVKGCCIIITGGTASTDPYLINWLYENAVETGLKLECSIDYEDEWLQEDCHWDYDRIFTFTWKIWHGNLRDVWTDEILPGSNYSSKILSWTFGSLAFIEVLNPIVVTTRGRYKNYERNVTTYTYSISLAEIFNTYFIAYRNGGQVTFYVNLMATDEYGVTNSTIKSLIYDCVLPPKQITSVTPSLVINNPGELKISWNKPGVYDSNSDSVHGYCIEIASRPESETSGQYAPIKGLKWDAEQLSTGKYVLVKDPDYIKQTFDSTSYTQEEITSGEFTFESDDTSREFYIPYPDVTEFYFKPKDIGIDPGDEYQITVYPYCKYSQYYEEGSTVPQPSAWITGGGTTGGNKISKGIVRVKTSGAWVDGQVWVYVQTSNGPKWVQAEAIYAMADDGTGKGVWKEAQ